MHVDPVTGKVGTPVQLPAPGKVYLVDPVRAHGRLGVVIVNTGSEGNGVASSIIPILGMCLDCREPKLKLGRAQHVTLDYRDLDQIDQRHDLIHVADLTPLVATSPDGALAATFAADRVTLRDAAGTLRWTIAAPGVSALAWTPHGELIALANGIVKLDLETGAFGARRCGWLFGVTHEPSFEGSPAVVCDAE
jgi:hypothetical protein